MDQVHIFPDGKEVQLLDASEAAERIMVDAPGSFFDLLTETDISVRMGMEGADGAKGVDKPGLERFKAFVRRSVRDWTARERQAMLEVLRLVHEQCGKAYASLIPRKWRFIKTSGAEEFGYFYTRGDSIVIPGPAFNHRLAGGDMANLAALMLHETFHVYSRLNPDKKALLYQRIGFSRLEPLNLGGFLTGRRMTNPDGADCSYAIKVENNRGEDAWIVPVVFWDGKLNSGFFELEFKDGWWRAVGGNGFPRPVNLETVKGFYEQVGRNTDYLIHPDEILAENVVLLVNARFHNHGLAGKAPDEHSLRVLHDIEQVLLQK